MAWVKLCEFDGWDKNLNNKYLPFTPSSIINEYKSIYDDKNWITQKGRIYKISDMTIKHIVCSMRLVSECCKEFNLNKYNYIAYENLKEELLSRI